LCWLPDLGRWAEVIVHFLKPGGTFYIVEGHPFTHVFYNEDDATDLKVTYSYFYTPEPTRWEPQGSYADRNAQVFNPSYEWTHSLGDILNALISAGLRIEFLHEFPYGGYSQFPFMEQDGDGRWRLKEHHNTIPLMFSLKATKE
jgi:hypothetical protein